MTLACGCISHQAQPRKAEKNQLTYTGNVQQDLEVEFELKPWP